MVMDEDRVQELFNEVRRILNDPEKLGLLIFLLIFLFVATLCVKQTLIITQNIPPL